MFLVVDKDKLIDAIAEVATVENKLELEYSLPRSFYTQREWNIRTKLVLRLNQLKQRKLSKD